MSTTLPAHRTSDPSCSAAERRELQLDELPAGAGRGHGFHHDGSSFALSLPLWTTTKNNRLPEREILHNPRRAQHCALLRSKSAPSWAGLLSSGFPCRSDLCATKVTSTPRYRPFLPSYLLQPHCCKLWLLQPSRARAETRRTSENAARSPRVRRYLSSHTAVKSPSLPRSSRARDKSSAVSGPRRQDSAFLLRCGETKLEHRRSFSHGLDITD